MEWQPIETAPKDGTDILAVDLECGAPAVVYWNDNPAWNCWCLSAVLLSLSHETELSHWCHLPQPPKQEGNENGNS